MHLACGLFGVRNFTHTTMYNSTCTSIIILLIYSDIFNYKIERFKSIVLNTLNSLFPYLLSEFGFGRFEIGLVQACAVKNDRFLGYK